MLVNPSPFTNPMIGVTGAWRPYIGGYGVKTVSCILLLALYRADFPVDVNVGRIMVGAPEHAMLDHCF
jgi:hypothetical protein